MIRVLFLCTGNSARSQMSEALLRHLCGVEYEVASVDTAIASEVNSFALEVLKEKGIQTDSLHSKIVDSIIDEFFDVVITVCDHAKQMYLNFPNAMALLHWSLQNPAAFQGTYEAILITFRKTRNTIEKRIRGVFNIK